MISYLQGVGAIPLRQTLTRMNTLKNLSRPELAYDYEAQRWVEGPAAVRLRLAQLQEELDLLTGPRGLEYFRFTANTGGNRSKTGGERVASSLDDAIGLCRFRISELVKEVAS